MTYRGIIYDLDGVICNTDEYHYEAWKSVSDEEGIYFDRVINNRLRGVSRRESLEIILERYEGEMSEEKKLEVLERKNGIYLELLEKMTAKDLSAEVKETLDLLRAKGLKQAIGSSSRNAVTILNKLGLGDYFDAISDGSMIARSKPDPEVFLLAASMIGLEPKECLVVEDAIAGAEAAQAGGMDCAAMGDAVSSEIPKYKLNSFSDLLDLFPNL